VAEGLGRPLVLFVDAPLVWEARKWGVSRPGWAGLVERAGERPQFLAADLVACVSEEVAAEVEAHGVSRRRIEVTPCGVDLDVFTPSASGDEVRRRYGLEGKMVVGWVGSFRSFHGVELALEAASRLRDRIPELSLLLVGDGLERPRMEGLALDLGLSNIVFTGTVPYQEVATHISAMDVALVLDRGDQSFHYSPLKLKEYAACGRAIIAPRVGELGRLLCHDVDSVLVPPGDPGGLADAVEGLHGDPERRRRLASAARAKAAEAWSWDRQLHRVVDALNDVGTAARTSSRPA
jgi:glycosyltransferase involved in cell wall biosynthesis